jgi:hypothetical protein
MPRNSADHAAVGSLRADDGATHVGTIEMSAFILSRLRLRLRLAMSDSALLQIA